jgi:hypothetical protein
MNKTKLDFAKRLQAVRAIQAKMRGLVSNVPEDNDAERDLSERRLRALGQVERISDSILLPSRSL